MDDPVSVSYTSVAAFIRQHAHDLRNDLNGMDLEAAFISEIVTEPEAAEAILRLRAQIRETANALRALTAKLAEPEPSRAPFAARDLFLVWQDEAARLGLNSIAWRQTLGPERVNVDAGEIAKVFAELLTNAKQFGEGAGLVASVAVAAGRVCFELRENGKADCDPTAWGSAPFSSTRRGAYGLGLWEADRLIRANAGRVERALLPDGILVTKLTFAVE